MLQYILTKGIKTMLKTNSKAARENIRAYIMENFSPENYTSAPPSRNGAPGCLPCLTLAIITTVQPCRISAKYWKKQKQSARSITKATRNAF